MINQNGIIFGGSAQINVGSLIAAAVDVGPTTFGGASRRRRPQHDCDA
ncbi:MAG: hypothetical protein WDN50_06375 [Bradyrhizobium sp.]